MSRRSTDAFTKIYEERVSQVYGFFGYRLGSREDAEDLTQLTFERALRAWDRFDARRASASTWLMAIARNLLVDHYRSGSGERHQPFGPEGVGETALGLESPQERGVGISPDLEDALSRLGKRDRELVALRFGADLSGPEIAELTGLKLANVQQILSRSLRRLRVELDAAESEHSPEQALKQLARSA